MNLADIFNPFKFKLKCFLEYTNIRLRINSSFKIYCWFSRNYFLTKKDEETLKSVKVFTFPLKLYMMRYIELFVMQIKLKLVFFFRTITRITSITHLIFPDFHEFELIENCLSITVSACHQPYKDTTVSTRYNKLFRIR